jgi:hypothetical protein
VNKNFNLGGKGKLFSFFKKNLTGLILSVATERK